MIKRIVAGMSWPENGKPAFFCVVSENEQNKVETLEEQKISYDVIEEKENSSLSALFEEIKTFSKLDYIYVKKSPKYISFMDDYQRWRHKEGFKASLRNSTASSFEAGVLAIKDLVTEKTITFKDKSIIKTQLQVFSRLSLKEENDFYAVSALTHITGAIKPRRNTEQGPDAKISAWY